jgi:hypothetical protein
MATLSDMEELLSRVRSSDVKDYMHEAMICYMTGAYRGCIVLSYIALFDDLLAKLDELSKINTEAKCICQEAKKKKSDQEVFESYLIDQLGSKKLLSTLDTSLLSTIRILRNKSAHPSGHKPSPEEARFIYYEIINRFLSQPILTTTQLVDEIIERLKNNNFFPTSQIEDITDVVKEEIKLLHDLAYPQLVIKLTKGTTSSDARIVKNACFFMVGLAKLDKPEINEVIQKKILQSKSDDADYHQLILLLVSSNAKLFKDINKSSTERFKKIFDESIENVKSSVSENSLVHPISVFNSLASVLTDDEILDTFNIQILNLFNRKPYSNLLIKSISNLPKTKKVYVDVLKKKAGSTTFDVANAFASSVVDIDKYLATIVSDEDAFAIVIAVLDAAESGAFGSQGLKKTKFAKTPRINAKAINYIKGNQIKAESYIKNKLNLDVEAEDFILGCFELDDSVLNGN